MAAVAVASVTLAAPASAQTARAAIPRSTTPDNAIIVDGQALVRNVRIDLRCGRTFNEVTCRVHLVFEITAGPGGAHVRLHDPPNHVDRTNITWHSGQRLPVDLAPADPRTIDVTYHVHDVGESGSASYIQPGIEYRHLVFGEFEHFSTRRRGVFASFLSGSGLTIEGTAQIERDTPGLHVTASPEGAAVPEGFRVWHTRQATPVVNGGPVLMLAGRLSLDAPGVRTFFAVGYEVGFLEHMLGSLWFETDGESISESLLFEAALPAAFYVLPSLAAGVGVVATQLGPRGADAALRVRLTAAWPAVGFFTDFDIFPADGHVSVNLGARVGI